MTQDPRPWGVYGRISKRKKGDGGGAYVKIEKQLADGQDYVRRAINPHATFRLYKDNLSAWDPDVYRPGYEAMRTALENGELAGIVAWHNDRFTRQVRQLSDLFDAMESGRASMWCLNSGQVTSKLMITVLTAIAEEESETKSYRAKSRHETLAKDGAPHGGRRRFGYEPIAEQTMRVRESEAEVIRDLVARLLAGESLASLARSLDKDGVATPQGGTWTGANLGTLLKSPHLAGIRVHGKDGDRTARTSTKATWDPILDENTHANVVDLLSDPGRRTTRSNARVYLLAGLGTCAACGAKLRGAPMYKGKQNPTGGRAYKCETGRHCHRSVEIVDAAVEALIVERLAQVDAAGALIDVAAEDDVSRYTNERDVIQRRLEKLTDDQMDGKISDEQLQRSSGSAEKRLKRLDALLVDARARAAAPAVALDGMTGELARQTWGNASLARRRTVIDFLCLRVSLRGAETRRTPFDPADVIVEWRDR